MSKVTPILILAGSVLFLIAAFLPLSKVFVEPDSEKKLALILGQKSQWNIQHVLFGLGSLLMVLGMGRILFFHKEVAQSFLSYVSILLLGAGAVLWCWHIAERIIDPSGFAHGSNTPYLFLIYSIFTQLGLILFGILLLRTPVPNWTAWMFIAGSILILILMIVFKDMPPFVYYLLTLIFSFALF